MSRLVIVDGNELRVVDLRVGGAGVTLPEHPTGPLAVRQPVWSPDGTRVAWSSFDRRRSDAPAFVTIADAAGGERTDHPVVFPAFYLHWRPDGLALAALGEGPLGIELSVIDAHDGSSVILSRGAPLFFDWAHDGTLCANVGRDRDARIEMFDSDGRIEALPELRPAAFTAPAWRDDDEVVVALRVHDRQHIVGIDRAGAVRNTYATVDGPARFVVSRDGRRLAWVDGATDLLTISDLERGSVETVSEPAPIAFTWSPDGAKLLLSTLVEPGEPPLLRPKVWAGGPLRSYEQHRPSSVVAREHLPFAEQHERSRSCWAPDSSAFCFAGTARGRSGVFVQPLDGASTHVGEGQLAMWSPC